MDQPVCSVPGGKKLISIKRTRESVPRSRKKMNSTEDLDYPQVILQYNSGFLVSKVMFTACELGVFDLLLESGEPLSSDAIAARLGTSTTGMERLLDACVGLKLLTVELTQEGALYRNTEISNIYLTKSSPKSQYDIMMYYSNTVYLCWHYLADAVREGRNQYERAFGLLSKDPFGAMYRSEEEMLKFMAGQNSVWSICGRDVLAAFDLSPFRQICDLGGGGGALARECVSLYPNSMVTIYDLPKVVQLAKEQFVPPEEHRITFHEGDFFNDSIPEAELYILSKILHDWDDDKCRQLLAKVYKACRPGGGVLLVESLLNEDRSGPLETQLYSMNMLVQTEGKERTAAEYSKLLEAAGFREVRVKRTGKLYDAVLGSGGVLLVESLLNEDRSGPLETQLYSMNVLVQTEGKERTAAEYSKLLEAAGFREVRVKRTGKLYDAVLGKK